MTNQIELYCKVGNHFWFRESQRGRKPINCPEHTPVKEIITGDTRVLHCQIGNHDWDAPRQRGRAPHNCPEHSVIKPTAVLRKAPNTGPEGQLETKYRTLWCEVGKHEWEAESRRGRPPRNCEAHETEGKEVRQVELKGLKTLKTIDKLEEEIAYHLDRVNKAQIPYNNAKSKVELSGGVNNCPDDLFNQMVRADSILMGEVGALRSRESDLAQMKSLNRNEII